MSEIRTTPINIVVQGDVRINQAVVDYESHETVCLHFDTSDRWVWTCGVCSDGETVPWFSIERVGCDGKGTATTVTFPEFHAYRHNYLFGQKDKYTVGVVLMRNAPEPTPHPERKD